MTDPKTVAPGWLARPQSDEQPAVLSPNGRRFFVLSFRGSLEDDGIIYQLDVYDVARVQTALRGADTQPILSAPPLRQLSLSTHHSAQNYAAIIQPHWENDRDILFLGVQGADAHRIYRFTVDSGALAPLTEERYDAVGFAPTFGWSAAGGSSVFTSLHPEPWNPLDEYPVVTVQSDDLSSVFSDAQRYWWRLNAAYRRGPARLIATLAYATGSYGPWMSPDGKWAVVVYVPAEQTMPEAWARYERRPQRGYRFMLIDIEHGRARPILDAPGGAVTESGANRTKPFDAFWSADSRHVVLLNTALPLTDDVEERQRMSYVIDYSVVDDEWRVLEPMVGPAGVAVHDGLWHKRGRELLITHTTRSGSAAPAKLYTFDGTRWITSKASQASRALTVNGWPKGLAVSVHQSVNHPPVLMASDGRSHVALTRPDPALEGLWRARAETIVWQEGERTAKGLLMLPRYRSHDARLPLVIHAFSYEPEAFRPDGATFSAFAAQALVAQGFAVLQIDLAYDDADTGMFTPQEGPARVARLGAAVESLSRRGLVDPERVGLIGFSRGGYSAYYAITHPGRVKLAAAVIFDSITASYGEYVTHAALGSMDAAIYEKQYGSGTFWQNKQAWIEGAPAFNVDKVVTPVLFSVTGDAWPALETMGAFRYCRRPFEYLFFPKGGHQLQRPRERMAAMQASVDWMNFWLQGRAPTQSSSARAARWQAMRTEWQRVQAEEAATRTACATQTPGP